jgi:hypothetical protein
VKGEEIEKMLTPIGLNSASITRLVLFSDGITSGSSDYGLIVSGSYKAATVVTNISAQGWGKQAYKGFALYSNSAGGQFLSILKGSLLVIGARDNVESAIDVFLNPKSSLTRQKNLNQLGWESGFPITIVLALTQEAQDMSNVLIGMSSFLLNVAGVGPLGELLQAIGFARALSCSISIKGSNFPVEIKAIMNDENSASFISGSLNLLKGTATLIPRDRMSAADRDTVDRFQDLKVTRNGEILSIKVSIPESQLLR